MRYHELDIRNNLGHEEELFCGKDFKYWKCILREVMELPSLVAFKNRLDVALSVMF